MDIFYSLQVIEPIIKGIATAQRANDTGDSQRTFATFFIKGF